LFPPEIENLETKPCTSCGTGILLDNKFCKHCGARQSGEAVIELDDNWRLLKSAALFYAIDITICCLVKFAGYFKSLSWFLFFDILMAIITVVFFADKWAENKKLLAWRSFSWQKLAAYAALAIAAQIVVHYSVTWLNIAIYSKDEEYYSYSSGNYLAFAFIVFFTAVMPAFFEELGYRGYLMQTLLKVTDSEQAIYISGFLFAILHMSFISLFWLIPFALFAGITRIRENTLWYGIFFHFFFNLSACVFELR
jgi:membrane protease YdiL (CAAX protease family)